ncbi:MAG: cytochrome c3 family protein, partial [Desulfuromonas sp.]
MKVKQWFSFCALLCSILLLSACGSNSGSGGDQSAGPAEGDLGTDTAGIKYVGSAKCIGCHDDFSWSTEIVDAYLMGKHVIHSDHITAADKVNGCLVCHDPIGDGPLLEAFIDAANVPTEGLAAIGCEACHGAGGDHYGIGPMPIAKPGIDACAQCHDKLPEGHLVHHPEADMISSNFVESRHFTASVRNSAVCSKCHTDVGGRLYKDIKTKTQLNLLVMAVDSTEPVQCKTCHDPHHAGGLLMEASRNSSSEYETCVTCHMSDRDDPADLEWMYHENVYYRVITDTHYDDPATLDVIEGYAISKLNDRACRDCHDVHSVKEIQRDTDTINDQWARSRHAGEIGIVKKEKAEEYAADNMDRTTEQTVAIKEAGVLGNESSWPH